jgi:hypothetical protein
MIQRSDRSGFLLKASAVRAFELLERDNPVQSRIPGLPHLAHAAGANACQDLARAEFLADGKRHVWDSVYPK